ncbi:MAG: hypothetical protein U0586_14770 [Candidatus Brocadiaceae bacterium]
MGDLNDHKVEYAIAVPDKDSARHPVTIELRFPKQSIENSEEWESFQNDSADFTVTKKCGLAQQKPMMCLPTQA